jgi:PAS domain S-box-containing protein
MTQELPEQLFRWIVESMPEAVVYSDREGIIRLWNRGAEAIFGYSQEDALGHTLDLIIPERWRARHWEGYRTVMLTGVTRYGQELLAVPASRSDGTRISIEFSIILPTDRDGKVLGAVAIVRDVTTRWKQEQALRKRLAAAEVATISEGARSSGATQP